MLVLVSFYETQLYKYIYYGPTSIRVVDFIDYTIISLLLQALPITYERCVDSQCFDNDTSRATGPHLKYYAEKIRPIFCIPRNAPDRSM